MFDYPSFVIINIFWSQEVDDATDGVAQLRSADNTDEDDGQVVSRRPRTQKPMTDAEINKILSMFDVNDLLLIFDLHILAFISYIF